jgi:hypothetical protein
MQDKRTHYSACPDDKVFRHLALLYASYNPGMRASRSFSNGVTNGAQWYPLWGGMQDWNYLQSGCLELTLELSDDKWPSTRELPRLWADNRQVGESSYEEYPNSSASACIAADRWQMQGFVRILSMVLGFNSMHHVLVSLCICLPVGRGGDCDAFVYPIGR